MGIFWIPNVYHEEKNSRKHQHAFFKNVMPMEVRITFFEMHTGFLQFVWHPLDTLKKT
jgi:hypothetical protein